MEPNSQMMTHNNARTHGRHTRFINNTNNKTRTSVVHFLSIQPHTYCHQLTCSEKSTAIFPKGLLCLQEASSDVPFPVPPTAPLASLVSDFLQQHIIYVYIINVACLSSQLLYHSLRSGSYGIQNGEQYLK